MKLAVASAGHEDVQRVFRYLLSQDALVLGAVGQPVNASNIKLPVCHPSAKAAEAHLHTVYRVAGFAVAIEGKGKMLLAQCQSASIAQLLRSVG